MKSRNNSYWEARTNAIMDKQMLNADVTYRNLRKAYVKAIKEIEADVKNNGYWWDKKTGFVQQWGRVNAKAEGTTITLTKPMQFTLSATASPGTNSNNAIVQIFSTSGTSLVVKPDIDCTVYWHVIGYATE